MAFNRGKHKAGTLPDDQLKRLTKKALEDNPLEVDVLAVTIKSLWSDGTVTETAVFAEEGKSITVSLGNVDTGEVEL